MFRFAASGLVLLATLLCRPTAAAENEIIFARDCDASTAIPSTADSFYVMLIFGLEDKPVFEGPLYLDLGGQGIRSIEYWADNQTYLIVSGNTSEDRGFQVFKWTGRSLDKPIAIFSALSETTFNPEAIVLFPNEKSKYLLLSDDGSRANTDGKRCKDLPTHRKSFTGLFFTYP